MSRPPVLLGLTILLLLAAGHTSAAGTVHVGGYTRANGTYVAPYYRSAPGSGSGSVGGTALPLSTVTSTVPGPPSEPAGTYAGWSSDSPGWATPVLGTRFGAAGAIGVGYSHRQTATTSSALRALLARVLKDEAPTDASVFVRMDGAAVLVLVFRADAPRALLLRIDGPAATRTVQVLGFSYATSTPDLSGYADSSSGLLSSAVDRLTSPAVNDVPAVSQAVPLQTPATADGLTLDANSMFVDPESGNIVVAAICAPFSLTFRPAAAFSRVLLKVAANSRADYHLNVLADGKLRFTQPDFTLTAGKMQELLVGAQTAGTPVTLTFTNAYAVDCRATLTLSLSAN